MTDISLVKEQLSNAVHQNKALSKTGILERIFSKAFTGLVYAQIWEDPVIDMRALQIEPHHNLVCIASGGCNVMSYLVEKPNSITAVDLSPAHVALNKAKLEAIRSLPCYKDFFQLFGRADVRSNTALFKKHILAKLDQESAHYWNARKGFSGQNIDMFGDGFYRHGLLGRFISACHILARLSGVRLQDWTLCKTRAEQDAFFSDKVEPALDKPIVRWIINNRISLFGLGIPPQQYDALAASSGGDMHAVLKERTRSLMCDFDVSQNYFAWQAFNRGYKQDGTGPLPPYLQAEHFETVREASKKVVVLNRSFTDYLREQPAQSKHGYVLLDAQDWMNDDQLNALWDEITRTAAEGAKVIFRTAGLNTILPGRVKVSVLSRWAYNYELSAELTKQDRSAIYGGFHLYTLRSELS